MLKPNKSLFAIFLILAGFTGPSKTHAFKKDNSNVLIFERKNGKTRMRVPLGQNSNEGPSMIFSDGNNGILATGPAASIR